MKMKRLFAREVILSKSDSSGQGVEWVWLDAGALLDSNLATCLLCSWRFGLGTWVINYARACEGSK